MTAPNQSIRARIDAHLNQTDATASQISEATGIPKRSVTLALQDMVNSRGIYKKKVKHGGRPIYTKSNPDASRKLPARYIPEFRELTAADYDIHEHGRMAVGGR